MNTALVIIDMQRDFVDYPSGRYSLSKMYEKKIESICRAIQFAKKQNWPIIVVEYSRYGGTIYKIAKAIGRYKNMKIVLKSEDDGSYKLGPVLRRMKVERVFYTGCNSDACVRATVDGMTYEMENAKHIVYLPGTMTFNAQTVKANQASAIRNWIESDCVDTTSRLVA